MIHVGLVFGGKSHEHEVSITSAMSFLKNINFQKYQVTPFYIQKNGVWLKYETIQSPVGQISDLKVQSHHPLPPLEDIVSLDVMFPLIHGETGEDGKIQGLFEMLDVPYVGCNVEASAVGMNKVIAKDLAKNIGNVEVVPSIVVRKEEWEEKGNARIPSAYPIFVKPARAGSSIGISKAYNKEELKTALDEAFKIDDVVLLEKNIEGREIEVGVIGTKVIEVSMPGEITFASDFYDYENKYHHDTSVIHIPAKLSNEQIKKLQKSAKSIYRTLGCSGYSRVDFFLENETNTIYFNEINTSPGMTEKSMFPVLFSKTGYNFSQLLDKIISNSIEVKVIDSTSKRA